MDWNGFFAKKKIPGIDDAGMSPDVEETAVTQTDISADDISQVNNAQDNNNAIENADVQVNAEEKPEKASTALCEFDLHVKLSENGDVGRAALYLAMSEDIADERHVKDALSLCGWKAVATEIGGISGNIQLKASRAIVGAALNSGVVRKSPSEMHALMHAAQEAFGHFIPYGLIECSIGAKIAIVRNSQWLAVAVSGDTAYHAIAHHERVGVGVMHL